jgi:hypothetical protein
VEYPNVCEYFTATAAVGGRQKKRKNERNKKERTCWKTL